MSRDKFLSILLNKSSPIGKTIRIIKDITNSNALTPHTLTFLINFLCLFIDLLAIKIKHFIYYSNKAQEIKRIFNKKAMIK